MRGLTVLLWIMWFALVANAADPVPGSVVKVETIVTLANGQRVVIEEWTESAEAYKARTDSARPVKTGGCPKCGPYCDCGPGCKCNAKQWEGNCGAAPKAAPRVPCEVQANRPPVIIPAQPPPIMPAPSYVHPQATRMPAGGPAPTFRGPSFVSGSQWGSHSCPVCGAERWQVDGWASANEHFHSCPNPRCVDKNGRHTVWRH